MVRDAPAQPEPPPKSAQPYPAEKARGGEIILRTRTRRWIFAGGLIGLFVLALFMRLLAG